MPQFSSGDSTRGLRRRGRPIRSCRGCQRRKVKCDLKQPCSNCVLSTRVCSYETSKLSTLEQPSHATVAQLSERGSDPTSDVSKAIPVPVPVSTPRFEKNLSANSQSRSTVPKGLELEELRRLLRTIKELLADSEVEPLRETDGAASGGLDRMQSQRFYRQSTTECQQEDDRRTLEDKTFGNSSLERSLPQNQQLRLNKSRLYGLSHWTNGGHEFKKVAIIDSESTQNADVEASRYLRSEIAKLHHKCKGLAKSVKASRASRSILCPSPSSFTTNKIFADRMAYLYVSRFESAFRILHVPTFWTEYELYWTNSDEASSAVQFKIRLALAIGSSLYQDGPNVDSVRSASCDLVHTAQNWVSAPMEKDRLSLSGLQVQCLLVLARQVLSIGGDLIWITVGTLLRTAMQMGLHRDPKHFAQMNILHAEVRRRLWATILEMNLQASLDSGMPFALLHNDYDTESPTNINDEDIGEDIEVVPQCRTDVVTDTSIQRFLLQHLRPRMEIIRHANGFCVEFTRDETQSITSQMNDACDRCGDFVPVSDESGVKVFRHNMTDLLLRRFLLTLHRPLVSTARMSDAISYFSRKICLDSATTLLSPLPNADFSHLILLGGGIFKNRIIHAALAICSEILIEVEKRGHAQHPSLYRIMLTDALKRALWQTAERVRFGETNTRLHMKLSMVLCLAESSESGILLQQHMMLAAKESLQMSFAAMKAHSSSVIADLPHHTEGITFQDLTPLDFDMSIDDGFDELFGMTDLGLDGLLW